MIPRHALRIGLVTTSAAASNGSIAFWKPSRAVSKIAVPRRSSVSSRADVNNSSRIARRRPGV